MMMNSYEDIQVSSADYNKLDCNNSEHLARICANTVL